MHVFLAKADSRLERFDLHFVAKMRRMLGFGTSDHDDRQINMFGDEIADHDGMSQPQMMFCDRHVVFKTEQADESSLPQVRRSNQNPAQKSAKEPINHRVNDDKKVHRQSCSEPKDLLDNRCPFGSNFRERDNDSRNDLNQPNITDDHQRH